MNQMTSQGTEIDRQSVVLHDRFDAQAFGETLDMYPPLQEVIGEGKIHEAETFVEDVFCSFYKAAPTLAEQESLSLSAQIRRHMVAEMMQTSEYQQVRAAGTMYDQFSSAIATTAVSYKVVEKLDAKTRKRLNKLQEAEAEAEQLLDQANALSQLAGQLDQADESVKEMYQQAEQLREQAQASQEKAEDLYEELEQQAEQLEDAARRASREGLEQASDEIDQANAAIAAYSGHSLEPGQGKIQQNAKEKLALARRIMANKKLAKIAELAGKMVNTALHKQRTKVFHPPDEIVGVTTGADFNLMLSSELLKLADPLYEMLFYQQYLEKSLMQFDMRGHEKQAKGPIIAVVDTSGSMEDPLLAPKKMQALQARLRGLSHDEQEQVLSEYTTKEVWSKAVLVALLAIAHKQRRDFAVIYFSSPGQVRTFRFPRAVASSQDLIKMAEFFFGGGTSYDAWMRDSLAMTEESRYSNADVIVISDGDVAIAERTRQDYNDCRVAKQMHSYGVLLSHSERDGQRLASVTDAMVTISDLEQDAAALDMMFSI